MKVTFARAARVDLEDIARYLWEVNPSAAIRTMDGIVESCEGLTDMPYRYPLMLGQEQRGFRRRRFEKYLIFFRVKDDVVEVARILHCAMDYEKVIDDAD